MALHHDQASGPRAAAGAAPPASPHEDAEALSELREALKLAGVPPAAWRTRPGSAAL